MRYRKEPHTPGLLAIVDTHANNEAVAYAPSRKADQVVAALEAQANAKADQAKAWGLVQQAFMEGMGLLPDVTATGLLAGWQKSKSRQRLEKLTPDLDTMPSHPLTDMQVFSSPNSSPIDRMAAHGRMAMKGEI